MSTTKDYKQAMMMRGKAMSEKNAGGGDQASEAMNAWWSWMGRRDKKEKGSAGGWCSLVWDGGNGAQERRTRPIWGSFQSLLSAKLPRQLDQREKEERASPKSVRPAWA